MFFIIFSVLFILENNTKSDNNKSNKESIHIAQDTENTIEFDADGIETTEKEDYTLLLRGSARPVNGEISAEEAAEIGIEEFKNEFDNKSENYTVEMAFLDGITTKTGTWSGNIKISDNEEYEFLLDGNDGNLVYISKK
jgi:hypothetical protein